MILTNRYNGRTKEYSKGGSYTFTEYTINNVVNYWTIGSTKDEVRLANNNCSESYSSWNCPDGTIEFLGGGNVSGFSSNQIAGLKPRTPSGTWTINSSKEDVLNAVGNPTSASYSEFVYSNGTIEFLGGGNVSGFSSNQIAGLKPRTPSGTWTINSSKEDVLNAVGNPTSASYSEFVYSNGTIEFLGGGNVSGFSSNQIAGLKPRTPSGTWTINSSKEDVLNATGNPTSASLGEFVYSNGTIEFGGGQC